MSYKPFPVQVKAHRAFLVDGYKRGMLYWSRRTGKSAWAMQQIFMSALMNQGPHHMVFKEYQQAETVSWNQYLPLIPKAFIESENKSTLTVTFKRFRGKIKLPICQGSCKTIDGKLQHFDDCDCFVIENNPDKPPATLRFLGSTRQTVIVVVKATEWSSMSTRIRIITAGTSFIGSFFTPQAAGQSSWVQQKLKMPGLRC